MSQSSYLTLLEQETDRTLAAAGLAPDPARVATIRSGLPVEPDHARAYLLGMLGSQVEIIAEKYASGDDAALRRTLTNGLAIAQAARTRAGAP